MPVAGSSYDIVQMQYIFMETFVDGGWIEERMAIAEQATKREKKRAQKQKQE